MDAVQCFQGPDGLQLTWRDYPARAAIQAQPPVLLCLPGLTRNSRDFLEVAARYAGRWRVLCPDFRGRGESDYDPQPERYHPLTYSADCWALLDHLGIDRVVLLGTSLGGLVSLLMVNQQPARIAGVILNDIGPEIDPTGLARIRGYVGRGTTPSSWPEAAAQLRQVHQVTYPAWDEAQWLRHARAGWREQEGVIRADFDPAIARAVQQDSGVPPAAWGLVDALCQPTLVVRGGHSDILSVSVYQQLLAQLPQGQGVEVSGVGHAPQLDEPEALQALDQFLERFS